MRLVLLHAFLLARERRVLRCFLGGRGDGGSYRSPCWMQTSFFSLQLRQITLGCRMALHLDLFLRH